MKYFAAVLLLAAAAAAQDALSAVYPGAIQAKAYNTAPVSTSYFSRQYSGVVQPQAAYAPVAYAGQTPYAQPAVAYSAAQPAYAAYAAQPAAYAAYAGQPAYAQYVQPAYGRHAYATPGVFHA